MRLFIAYDIDEPYLFELQKRFSDLSFVKSFHLTFKFLGEVEDEKVPKIAEVLRAVKFTPIDSRLSELGVFPNLSRPSVVWVGLENPEEIIAVQRQIDAMLGKFFPNDYAFLPHITLARVKFVSDKEEFKKAVSTEIEHKPLRIDHFRLKKSTLTPSGPVYEDIAFYKV